MSDELARFQGLPGADLVEQGLADLRERRESPAAMLVSMASPRLRDLGIEIPFTFGPLPSHRPYDLLEAEDPRTAHSTYNALIRRMVSFARAAERQANAARLLGMIEAGRLEIDVAEINADQMSTAP